jgi:uncharacterized membrane protein required for colicin V production
MPCRVQAMKLDLIPNWFDLVVLATVISGVLVGRKRGMSLELLDLLQWLAIIFVSGMAYVPLGKALADSANLGALSAFVLAYLLVAACLKLLFLLLKRLTGEKLLGSDTFGGYEYYLGMVAGGVRFLCILMFVLALMHAKQVSKTELDSQLKDQKENLGSVYFPPYGTIQRSIFQESACGRAVQQYLAAQLITVDPSVGRTSRNETIYRKHQRDLDEVTAPRR